MTTRMIDDDDRYAGIRTAVCKLIEKTRHKRDQKKLPPSGVTWRFDTIDKCIVDVHVLPKAHGDANAKVENIVISVSTT